MARPHSVCLIGQTIGKLLVVGKAPTDPGFPRETFYICRCACGNTTVVRRRNLILYGERKLPRTQSCGCLRSSASGQFLADYNRRRASDRRAEKARQRALAAGEARASDLTAPKPKRGATDLVLAPGITEEDLRWMEHYRARVAEREKRLEIRL